MWQIRYPVSQKSIIACLSLHCFSTSVVSLNTCISNKHQELYYSTAVLNRKMSFSDISSAIILLALVCIAHMVFHLFSVHNSICFAKFSFRYGEIQGFQMPFSDFKLTSPSELLRNWKWSLAVSTWVMVVVAEVEGLAHSILSSSAKKLSLTTSNFYFISSGKKLSELWTYDTF